MNLVCEGDSWESTLLRRGLQKWDCIVHLNRKVDDIDQQGVCHDQADVEVAYLLCDGAAFPVLIPGHSKISCFVAESKKVIVMRGHAQVSALGGIKPKPDRKRSSVLLQRRESKVLWATFFVVRKNVLIKEEANRLQDMNPDPSDSIKGACKIGRGV